MEYNAGLLEICDNNTMIYSEIWSRWKQINPDTRIELVAAPVARISFPTEFNPVVYAMIDSVGVRAWLWRMIGTVLRSKKITNRGREYPPPRATIGDTEELQLEQFGVIWRDGTTKSFRVAYRAATDTLYIRK
jgi:hypothetical protein